MKNTVIFQAFFDHLHSAGLGYPIAWPDVDFTPPATGVWLEVLLFPNQPIDPTLSDSRVIPRGFFQVMACARKGEGVLPVTAAAESVMDAFPKLSGISGLLRVYRQPYLMEPMYEDNRTTVPVTIPYST